jgi:hypothetical protein
MAGPAVAAYVAGCREGSYDLVPCDQVWGLGLVEIYRGDWSLMGCRAGNAEIRVIGTVSEVSAVQS